MTANFACAVSMYSGLIVAIAAEEADSMTEADFQESVFIDSCKCSHGTFLPVWLWSLPCIALSLGATKKPVLECCVEGCE